MLQRMRDILGFSLHRLFRQRRRYAGPACAILLGTAGLIVVVTLRGEVKKKANENLDLLGGATVLHVYYEEKPKDIPWTAKERFFYSDVINEIERLPGVSVVSLLALKSTPATLISGGRQGEAPLVAVDEYFWKLHRFTAVAGAFFDKEALTRGERVCVLGADVARRLFDTEEVAGQGLIIDNELYEIVAVLGGFRVGEGTRFVFVPLTTALHRISHMSLPCRLFVRCTNWENVMATAEAIPKAIGKYLPTDRLRVDGAWDNLKRVRRVAHWLEVFADVCVIGMLTLGGIGIWNLQMAAVRARTREIVIMKAVGAEDRDILVQFLTESVALCMGCVLVGSVLGWVSMEGIALILGSRPPLEVLLRSVFWSVMFGFGLGVVAGIYPALKASRLEVAATLRYE